MGAAGQTITQLSAVVPAAQDTTSTGKRDRTSASTDDKSLENKEFSNVLDEQREGRDDGTVQPAYESTSPAGEQAESTEQAGQTGGEQIVGNGSGLPVGGTQLPPGQQAPVLPYGHSSVSTQPAIEQATQALAADTVDSRRSVANQAVPDSDTTQKAYTNTGLVYVGAAALPKSSATEQRSAPFSHPIATVTASAASLGLTVDDTIPVDTKHTNSNLLSVSPQHLAAQSTDATTKAVGIVQANVPIQLAQKPLVETAISGIAADIINTVSDDKKPPVLTGTTASAIPQAYQQNSASTALHTTVPIEVGKPGWGEAVMGKVMWMSSQQINRAEIALDPPELGPLQVRVTTSQDQTSVVFSSNHASVRDALDQGVARLREMMDGQGLNLGDVDVSDQRTQQQDSSGSDDDPQSESVQLADAENNESGDSASDLGTTQGIAAHSLGLVDQYI